MPLSRLPKVQVLLSTFNGERFIEELVYSVVNQSGVEVDLLVRDDGSTDNTVLILRKFAENLPGITLITGHNSGVVHSFFDLLKMSGGAEYYAFADQDDVWKPDKLIRAIQKLGTLNTDEPVMYYSRLEFVNEHLEHIGLSSKPVYSGFHNALVQNQATGCTVVLSDKARSVVVKKLPNWALMHDWWCYLVISALGKVVYDEKSYILYRKHGKNVTPATPFFALELVARIKRYLGDGKIAEKVTDQVSEFHRLYYSELSPRQKSITDEFLNARSADFFKRLRYVLFEQKVQRNTRLDNFILKILILTGKF